MSSSPDLRIGQGWDSHRFAPGRPLILGGVLIPHDLGLDGHSDADILCHAVTDALLGALGLGDIGLHFPDTDPQWRGANSLQFVRHAAGLVRQHNYQIVNLDATVILERPKLKEHRAAMQASLAAAASVSPALVNVKFKTAERVGPVGEGKSAEAQAIVLLSPLPQPPDRSFP